MHVHCFLESPVDSGGIMQVWSQVSIFWFSNNNKNQMISPNDVYVIL